MRLLVLLSVISCLGPVIRFRGHGLFYFFFILAVSDPILILRSLLVHNNNIWYIYYLVITILLISSLPNFKVKYKIGIIISALIYLLIDPGNLKVFITFILLQLFLTLYFLNEIINDFLNRREIKFYLVILVLYHISLLVSKYIYYTDLSLHLELYNYRLILNILFILMITILGPAKGFVVKFNFIERLLNKKRVVVYTNGINTVEIQDLKKYGLTDREIEVLKLISRGYTSKEIAEKLYLSKKTIDYYRGNIRAKLNLSKKSEIIHFLKEKNLFFETQESYQTK